MNVVNGRSLARHAPGFQGRQNPRTNIRKLTGEDPIGGWPQEMKKAIREMPRDEDGELLELGKSRHGFFSSRMSA